MTDEELQKLQDQLMESTFDAPEYLENMINEASQKVARDLAFKMSEHSEVEFEDKHYKFQATKKIINYKEYIWLVVLCQETYEEAKRLDKPYVPFSVNAEVENGLSYIDNMRSVVEAFFRHITGSVQPEVLPD